jgi:hypothetical protein
VLKIVVEEVSSEPIFAPSMKNVTPPTATLSVEEAERVTLAPDTIAPDAGTVTATSGGVVSGVEAVVNVWSVEVDVLPWLSVLVTWK